MDFATVKKATEDAATASDPEAASRVIVIYIAPGDGGLWIHRPGCGTHQLGGDGGEFAPSLRAAVEKLWPESSKKTRQWLRIACDFLARSPIARMLGSGGGDDEE